MANFSFDWAVGLFEGEGTILLRPRKYHTDIALSLTSTDQDIVQAFHTVVAFGKIYGPYSGYQPNRKPFWKWNCDNGEAVTVLLQAFLPMLGQRRRERALEVIQCWEARQLLPHYLASRKGVGRNTRSKNNGVEIIKDKNRKKA